MIRHNMIQHVLKTSVLFMLVLAMQASPPTVAQTSLQVRMTQLEKEIHNAEAIRDIKRLQYSYAHYAELGLWLDLGDLFARNGVAHYSQGDFKGPESLRKFYLKELGRDQLGLADGRIYPHIMIQPVVTVAADGKTARGRWHVIAMLGSYGASASWAGVVYENRYVFEDGVWKIDELSYGSQYSGRYSPPGLTVPKWDLPNHFTAQSAGDPAAASKVFASADVASGSSTFESLQQRWIALARSAQQLRDETDVLNLQHSYGYNVDRKAWSAVADLFSSNGSLELGLRGVYAGKDRIRRALAAFDGGNEVNDHLQLATVVHIAPGGNNAKTRGVELSVSGRKGQGAQWEEGIFENEYVKQRGVWKIRSVHYYPRVITDYELGWAKDAKPAPGPSTEFPPDRPSTEVYGIYPKMYYPGLHYPNPVTGVPVQYPPGIAAAPERRSPSGPATLLTPPKNVKELTTQLTELERQIHQSIAYDAVENLVSANGYSLDDSTLLGNALAIHQTIQPVIQVASDGQSATIRARLLKVGGKPGELTSGVYEGRAVNQGGVWKLQNLTLRQTWSSSFTQWMPVVERR